MRFLQAAHTVLTCARLPFLHHGAYQSIGPRIQRFKALHHYSTFSSLFLMDRLNPCVRVSEHLHSSVDRKRTFHEPPSLINSKGLVRVVNLKQNAKLKLGFTCPITVRNQARNYFRLLIFRTWGCRLQTKFIGIG